MITTTSNFRFEDLSFADQAKPNKTGGKYVTVAYQNNQVEFQLGSATHFLRVPFNVDIPPEDPTKPYFKVEGDAHTVSFLRRFEEETIKAATKHSVAWFKKQLSEEELKANFCSSIKEQAPSPNFPDKPDCIKLKIYLTGARPTLVEVAEKKVGADGVNKLTRPKLGTVDDIVQGCSVLVLARVGSGVWFKSKQFGTCLVASKILVVKDASPPQRRILEYDLGDVEMTDASDGE